MNTVQALKCRHCLARVQVVKSGPLFEAQSLDRETTAWSGQGWTTDFRKASHQANVMMNLHLAAANH